MSLKNVLWLLIGSLIYLKSSGQENGYADISFNNTSIDFQIIYEADGQVPITFEFINTSNKSLIINRIIAPGFSKIQYPTDSILPGKTGLITAIINPFGRPGYFKKVINVFCNVENSPKELTVKGKIVSGTFKSSFKYNIEGLSFKQRQLNLGYIFKGDRVTRYVPVINTTENEMEVTYHDLPPHISFSNKFNKLAPGKTGLIEITYDSRILNDWDFVIDKVTLSINDKVINDGLIVTSNIREDFSLLSDEDKTTSPKVSIPIKVFNYDTISAGEKIIYEFPVFNYGKRDLNIRTVKPTCGCTAVLPEKNIISPGDSTKIMVEFNSSGFLGVNKKGVTVITNDPENYKHFLWITGYVEQ